MSGQSARKTTSFAKGILQLSGGTITAQAITILSAPIISRLFKPDVFGTYSLLQSIVSIFAIAVCLRYEYAILLPDDDIDAANLFVISLIATSIISTLVGLLLWIFRDSIISLLKAPDILPLLWIIPIGLAIQGIFTTLNYWNSRSGKFGRLSIARIAASFTTSVLPITLAYFGKADFSALAFSWLAGTSVFTFLLAILLWRENGFELLSGIRYQRLKENIIRYRKFPLIDLWGGFINNLSWQLPTTLLAIYFSQTVVGYYGWANRIVLLPVSLIGSAIAQVFFQRSAIMRGEPERLTHIVLTVFRRLAIVGIFPALILAIAGPSIFSTIFGNDWNEAGIYAQILSPWMFFLFISSPLSLIFASLERQELSVPINIAIFISRVIALVIGGWLDNPRLAIIIWSFSGVVIYALLVIIILHISGVSFRSGLISILNALKLSAFPSLLILTGVLLSVNSTGITLITIVACLLYGVLLIRYDPALINGLLGAFGAKKLNNI